MSVAIEERTSVRTRDEIPLPSERSDVGPSTATSPSLIQRSIRPDHICVLTFDRPGSAANIFDTQTLTELRDHLSVVSNSANLKGLILRSAKPSIFIAGADLKMMSENASPAQV